MKRSAKTPFDTLAMMPRTSLLCILFLGTLVAGGCGAASHQEAPLDPTALNGKSQAWFQEHWGAPGAKSKRFFGGETWAYFRPLAECHIRLDFDRKGHLEDSGYSGC